jgi:hypothetical protein
MASRYPSNPELPPADISPAILYGMMAETRRDVYQRLDIMSEEMRRGVGEIKEILSDGREVFGRHDERIHSVERKIDDLESDVQKIPRGKIGDESSRGNKVIKSEKDIRIKIVNTLILAAVGAIGTLIGGYIVKTLTATLLAEQREAMRAQIKDAPTADHSAP